MKKIYLLSLLVLLFSCSRPEAYHNFKKGQSVLVDGRFNGIITFVDRSETLMVTWIDSLGQVQEKRIHHTLIKSK